MTLSGKMTADRVGGIIWIVLGAAIVFGSWMMDRLTHLQIHPATAPGLVPGLLGAGIALLGLILVFRKGEAATPDFGPADNADAATVNETPADDSLAIRRVGLSWILCVIYGGVLLGHGLPYWVLTAAFLFVHINLIDENPTVPAPLSKHRAVLAAILAVAFATAVALIFEHIFLVRLP